ncbi:MAG: phosphate acyltransferase PlsX [Alphaproteobacteria bacterium]|nr:phosphate acyltransferase PlsX [Alphaproteobacteria bacterium]
MSSPVIIAIDAMGGDDAPGMVIDGLKLAQQRAPDARYLIFGDSARIDPLLARQAELAGVCEVRHTSEAVSNDAKPSAALRSGRQTSMRLAIDAVRDGHAGGVVSAGNTGALMAMAKVVLRMLPGIHRPAIGSFFPTLRGESAMLDLGANVECDAENLVQFAIMGDVFARTVLGLANPSIGLLNVGAEELKGHEYLRAAAAMIRDGNLPLNFHGFIEGDDIAAGTVDVVVTDGFTGNVALKMAEGTARLYAGFLRGAFESSIVARIGYVLARRAIEKVRQRTDPRRYNGAMFLGLNGIVVKSHGGTDAIGFANAVGVAIDLLRNRVNDRIRTELERVTAAAPGAQVASA